MNKQRGMSFYAMCIVLVLVVFFGLLTVKLAPIYIDNALLKGTITNALKGEGDSLTTTQLREKISKGMVIDNITGPARDSISVTTEKGKLVVVAEYEVRVPIVYNVDVVVSFNDRYEG